MQKKVNNLKHAGIINRLKYFFDSCVHLVILFDVDAKIYVMDIKNIYKYANECFTLDKTELIQK